MNREPLHEETYSMQEIREMTGLSADTLRFYEKDGILGDVFRLPNGHRRYRVQDLDWLNLVICLRTTGMPLKEIKRYRQLLDEGDSTLEERKTLMIDQRAKILENISELQRALKKIEMKIAYYEDPQSVDCSKV